MSDKPVIVSAPMVRALLDGRKTQTRRVLKNLTRGGHGGWRFGKRYSAKLYETDDHVTTLAPTSQYMPYRTGDRLWVRETLSGHQYAADFQTVHIPASALDTWTLRRATTPSIHMPRWASRLTLIVTDVRVERVQDISEEDALSEGADGPHPASWHPDATEVGPESYRDGFRDLWNSLHKPSFQWDDNPWCAAVSFETHHANIDELREAA